MLAPHSLLNSLLGWILGRREGQEGQLRSTASHGHLHQLNPSCSPPDLAAEATTILGMQLSPSQGRPELVPWEWAPW